MGGIAPIGGPLAAPELSADAPPITSKTKRDGAGRQPVDAPRGLIRSPTSPNRGHLSALDAPSMPAVRFPASKTDAERREAAHDTVHTTAMIFKHGYGPWPLRRERGWSLDAVLKQAHRDIDALPQVTERGVQEVVKRLVDTLGDGHSVVSVADRRSRSLPFAAVQTADGAFAVSWVDRTNLPKGVTMQPGDVLTSIDGRPIGQVMGELAARESQTNPGAAMYNATQTLTTRYGSSLHEVPDAGTPMTLGLRDAAGKERTVTVRWSDDVASNPFTSGATHGYPKALGRVVQAPRANDPFASYVYEVNGRRVGYVRISTFSPTDDKGNEDNPVAEAGFVKRFQQRMRELATSTDALVVDLRDCSGGSTTVQNLLASSLSPVALRSGVDVLRMTARLKDETQKRLEQLDADVAANDLSNFFPDAKAAREDERTYLRRLLQEFDERKPFSSPMALDGMSEIPAARTPYTKPLVLLTNPGTVSSGETMPALFQDNRDRRQAVVIGERTGGLGGTIEEVSFPNAFGIKSISYTESLGIRVDGRPLEDNLPPERFVEQRGVVPDREIRLTTNDLRTDFADYKRSVNEVVLAEIAKYDRLHPRRPQRSQ